MIKIILKTGEQYAVPGEIIKQYQSVYKNVSVTAEIEKMAVWCLSNPARRKTKRGVLRFVNNWLTNANDKAKTNIAGYDNRSTSFKPIEDIVNTVPVTDRVNSLRSCLSFIKTREKKEKPGKKKKKRSAQYTGEIGCQYHENDKSIAQKRLTG